MPDAALLWPVVRALLLLASANVAPLAAKKVFGDRAAWPLDGGLRLPLDGRPLLGASKTVRGALSAVAACAAAGAVIGPGAAAGALCGAAAMLGDALSSFTKRRLGVPTSGHAWGLDQVPEALLPLVLLHDALGLAAWQVAAAGAGFLVLEPPLARLWHALGWRDQPW